jgi:hypothetical protein
MKGMFYAQRWKTGDKLYNTIEVAWTTKCNMPASSADHNFLAQQRSVTR